MFVSSLNGPGEEVVSQSGGVGPDLPEVSSRGQRVGTMQGVTCDGSCFPETVGSGDDLQGGQRAARFFRQW